MDAAELAASCLISSRVHHRLSTVTMHDAVLGWVQSGRKTLFGPHGATRIAAGEAFVAERGTQWDVDNDPLGDGHYRALILVFRPPLIDEFARLHAAAATIDRPHTEPIRLAIDAQLQEALQRTAEALQNGDSPALQRHRLLEVLLLLAERGVRFRPAALRWDERIRRLIGQRPQAAWTIDALAEAFHTSPSTLRRRIADSGLTLGELVREVRLETGLALLQSTDLAVGEIADRCGYASHSRFTAAFRTRFGFPPSQLRPA
jgi:AraC-like DNA-binding protein